MSVTVAFGLPQRVLDKRKKGKAAIFDNLEQLSIELSRHEVTEQDVGLLNPSEVLAMRKAMIHYPDRVYPTDVVEALKERNLKIDDVYEKDFLYNYYLPKYDREEYDRQMKEKNAAQEAAKLNPTAAKAAAESAYWKKYNEEIQRDRELNAKLPTYLPKPNDKPYVSEADYMKEKREALKAKEEEEEAEWAKLPSTVKEARNAALWLSRFKDGA